MSSLMSTLTSVTSTHTLTLHDALPISAAGVPVRINHARGGSTARGGARLDAIVHAMPADTVDGVLHVTEQGDRKSTRLNSSHLVISYAVFCLKTKIQRERQPSLENRIY